MKIKQITLALMAILLILSCQTKKTNSNKSKSSDSTIVSESNSISKKALRLIGKYKKNIGKCGWNGLEFKSNGILEVETIKGDEFEGHVTTTYKFENGIITMKAGMMELVGQIEENGNIKINFQGDNYYKNIN